MHERTYVSARQPAPLSFAPQFVSLKYRHVIRVDLFFRLILDFSFIPRSHTYPQIITLLNPLKIFVLKRTLSNYSVLPFPTEIFS